jgi:uncharacterized membrane protein
MFAHYGENLMNKLPTLNWFPLLLTLGVGTVYMLLEQTGITVVSLRLPLAVLLLLVVPGYAAGAALFPRPIGGWAERWLLTIGLSITTAILGSLGIFWYAETLNERSWAVVSIGVALVFSFIALVRTPAKQQRLSTFQLSGRQLSVAGVSGMLALSAILIAIWGEQVYQTTFTQLWVVPAADQQSSALSIGVGNFEGRTTTYSISVQHGQDMLDQLSALTLAPGEEQVVTLDIDVTRPYTQPITVMLYRADEQDTVYRSVHVWPE